MGFVFILVLRLILETRLDGGADCLLEPHACLAEDGEAMLWFISLRTAVLFMKNAVYHKILFRTTC